jgi:TonB family protein
MALPEIRLEWPTIDSVAITAIRFIDPDADLVPGVISPISAPRPELSATVDPQWYALRAGMTAGEAATVILSVEVLADGSVGDVSVTRSGGSAAIDEAAIAYIRRLQWIPGSVNRHARTMRIRWEVVLALAGSEP